MTTPRFQPGDIIVAPDPDHPGFHVAGVFAGASNATGTLRIMLETGPRGLVWCDAETAEVLPEPQPGIDRFAGICCGGSDTEPEPKEGGR